LLVAQSAVEGILLLTANPIVVRYPPVRKGHRPPRWASSAEPPGEALREGLFGASVDLGIGQGAERMVDDDRIEIRHAEGGALHFGFV
jgi:hypothetical protein